MMATTGLKETLVIPADIWKEKFVFGMDIGGSLIKVAYQTKEGNDIHVHFVAYVKEGLDDALGDIKEKIQFDDDTVVTTTGIGSYQYKDKIEETLGVKVNNVLEIDCFVNAFKFLVINKSLKDFIHPPSEKADEYFKEVEDTVEEMRKRLGETSTNIEAWDLTEKKDATLSEKDGEKQTIDDVFPCLFNMLGSGAGFMKVSLDGKIEGTDTTTSAGRMILGLGSLLCGTETFDELVDLAEQGDASKVEVQCKDMRRKGGKPDVSDIYEVLPAKMPIYGFGHCVGRKISDFRREDLAAAIISNVCQTLSMGCHLSNALSDVKMVFFCGSVCGQSQYIRDEISKHFGIRNRNNTFKMKPRPFYFLKYGGYLGALGALMWEKMENKELAENTPQI